MTSRDTHIYDAEQFLERSRIADPDLQLTLAVQALVSVQLAALKPSLELPGPNVHSHGPTPPSQPVHSTLRLPCEEVHPEKNTWHPEGHGLIEALRMNGMG